MSATNNNLNSQNQSFKNLILSSTKDVDNLIKESELLALEFYPVSSGNLHRQVELSEESSQSSTRTRINRFNSYLTGKFTRSTNNEVKFLKPEELEGEGYQAWAKRDLFEKATPIEEGIGKKLLEKMGWKQGYGLGKNKNGLIDPFTIPLKTDRKGLASAEDQPSISKSSVYKSNEAISCDKHPVSFLNEICSKKKWPEPRYELAEVSGPAHLPMFKMRVYVLDKHYEPQNASPNKKQAKADAAQVCLQSLGFIS